ncbi:MAG: PaaI family thioesterase [Roseovarius sp.]|nr:PaaI family thioesterase [Roseovarius sp.]
MDLKMTIEELNSYVAEIFPQVSDFYIIEKLDKNFLRVKYMPTERDVRPGGSVSGPTLFALADISTFMALLAMIGPVHLAVTTSCSIDFLRKPRAEEILAAECRVLKIGRVLAVSDVLVFSGHIREPVARASLTYSIPPGKAREFE